MNEKRKILIVEDDLEIREAIQEILDFDGLSWDSVSNGQEALDHLASSAELPSLILVDLMMPVMDGFKFCQEFHEHEEYASIPLVVMSADGQLEKRRDLCRATDYIRKPMDIDVFLEKVKSHCQ